jgi:hypothetical protein
MDTPREQPPLRHGRWFQDSLLPCDELEQFGVGPSVWGREPRAVKRNKGADRSVTGQPAQ